MNELMETAKMRQTDRECRLQRRQMLLDLFFAACFIVGLTLFQMLVEAV